MLFRSVKELVPEAKVEVILGIIKEIGPNAMGPIKSRLGDGYSFGEIRAVVSYFKFTKKASLGS